MTRSSNGSATVSNSIKSDEAMAAELSRQQRPKRQRNPTTYYTDDKPNTFTTKRYRGQFVYGPSVPSSSYTARDETAPSPRSPSPSSSSDKSSPSSSKMVNGKKTNNKKQQQQTSRRRGSNSSAASSSSVPAGRTTASSSLSLSPPKKRGPGRPPKRAKSLENPGLLLLGKVPPKTPVSSIHPSTTATSTPENNNKRTTTSSSRKRSPAQTAKSSTVDDEDNESEDEEDDVDEPLVKRRRGRPPKNRRKDEEHHEPPTTKSSSTSSSSSSTTAPKRRTSMTSNRPSHGHATRGGGAALLIKPIEMTTTTTPKSPTKKPTGKRGMKNAMSDDDVADQNTGRISNRRNRAEDTTITRQTTDASAESSSLSSPNRWRSSSAFHLTDASMSPGRRPRGTSSKKGKSTKSSSRTKAMEESSNMLEDVEGTFLSHSVTVMPILPPTLTQHHDTSGTGDSSKDRVTTNTLLAADDDVDETRIRSRFPAAFETGIPPGCSKTTSFVNKNQTSSSSTQTSSSSSSSDNVMDALPSWKALYNPPIFFEDDYNAESGFLDLKSTLPVLSRKITAVAVRQPLHDYLVLGDSIGFVTVYSLLPGSWTSDVGPRPVARLESVACQQRGRQEQERVRAEILRRRRGKGGGTSGVGGNSASSVNNLFYSIDPSTNALVSGSVSTVQREALGPTAAAAVANEANTPTAGGAQQLRSIVMNTSDTDIHALAMIANRVVLATQIELECMDVPSGTSLWVCPLSSNRIVTSLDMHLSTYDVLVSCSKSGAASNGATSATLDTASVPGTPISPLMLLQHSKDNVEICDANSPMLVRSPSCTAIWDCGNTNRLLFVALSSNRQELELVLVSGGSIDTWKVACKTKIPSKTPAHALSTTTKLSQSAGGHYTLVACTRGIRLYQTETLELIHVYGDQFALHGQSVLWKDCWLAGSYFQESSNNFRRARLPTGGVSSVWLECNDWLSVQDDKEPTTNALTKDTSETNQSSSSVPTLAPYLIGVPHSKKGPEELCDKLHVWKVDQAGSVPAISIPLPPKAEGALGLVGACGRSSSDDRLVLVTNDGQGHLLLPELESNFAGTMYPPGYQVVTDNIEYIENEDALDEVPDVETTAGDGAEDEEADVDVLEGEDEDMDAELREAMRQSLLELKKAKIAKDAQNPDKAIDVLATDSEDDMAYLPCRPEPYLRQAMISQSDDEEKDGDEETPIDEKEGHHTDDPRAPKIPSGAAFVSSVLTAMPNKEKPKEAIEEDCLSFTTTKVVMAVNPVVQNRPGRGRKGRAGNLDALIKSSINPYLQSLMLSKQSVPSNGSGSRVESTQETSIGVSRDQAAANPKQTVNQTTDQDGSVNGVDHGSVKNVHPETAGTPTPQPSTRDEAEVALGLLGLSPCNSTRPADVSTATVPTVPKGPTDVSDNGVPSYLSASSLSNFANKVESSVVTAINAPLNANAAASAESITTSSDRGSINGEHEITTEENGKRKQKVGDMKCFACRGRHVIHTCGKRSLPIDYDEVAKIERERKAKEEEEKKKARIEKRRLADQRRREAKKQRQRELEQQRLRDAQQERIELERQRRLQEDFASQDLNRLRRDQIVASYASHLSHMRDVEHAPPQNVAHVASVTTASNPSTARPFEQPPQVKNPSGVPQPGGTMLDRAASAGEAAATAASPVASQQGPALVNVAAVQPTATYSMLNGIVGSQGVNAQHITAPSASNPASNPAPAQATAALPRSPPQSATLDSADALVALATFAGASQALATSPSPAPHKSVVEKLSSYPYTIPHPGNGETSTAPPAVAAVPSTTHHFSHGFSSAMPPTSTMPMSSPPQHAPTEVKRSIPSYATIRGQINGNETATPEQQTTVPAAAAVTVDSFAAASSDNGGRVETYVWPARHDAAADAALAMTALGSMLMGSSSNGGNTAAGHVSDQSQRQP